jgi:hypothetical protein
VDSSVADAALGGVSHGWVDMPRVTRAKQAFQILGGTSGQDTVWRIRFYARKGCLSLELREVSIDRVGLLFEPVD